MIEHETEPLDEVATFGTKAPPGTWFDRYHVLLNKLAQLVCEQHGNNGTYQLLIPAVAWEKPIPVGDLRDGRAMVGYWNSDRGLRAEVIVCIYQRADTVYLLDRLKTMPRIESLPTGGKLELGRAE